MSEESIVVASVWGSEPKSTEVKISSTVLEKLLSSDAHRMPGWRVETLRYIRSHGTINWQVDYQTLDTYKPHVSLHENFSPNPA